VPLRHGRHMTSYQSKNCQIVNMNYIICYLKFKCKAPHDTPNHSNWNNHTTSALSSCLRWGWRREHGQWHRKHIPDRSFFGQPGSWH
jgi:hypothetical protein